MYKDKNKRRDTDRERQRRYRRDKQGVTITKAESHVDVSGIGIVKTIHQHIPKRGKDIECLEDLPEDVQLTIHRVVGDQDDFNKRVAAAIRYQHVFPDRFDNHSCVMCGLGIG